MQQKYILTPNLYDGSQLRHLFAYLDHNILGDSIVSWRGACDIAKDKIIDGQDLKDNSIITSQEMLHFIIEKFNSTLFSGVALQRIFVSLIKEDMQERGFFLKRKGDDLYFSPENTSKNTSTSKKNTSEKKFNISIATQSNTSSMIHLAVNITTKGTPIPTISLNDFNICSDEEIKTLSEKWMNLFACEVDSITKATQKVFLI
ncbi:MAG: DUF366 family protein [Bdellovibrionales bacterium]|nr:DUF366 family protein [Bdellovibrionales bacterium]